MDRRDTRPSAATALPHPPDAVLFDFDGTIVDSRVPYTRSMNHALAHHGLPTHPPQELYQYLGPPIHETLLEGLHTPAELVEPVITTYRERYAELGLTETVVFDGIPELLRDLHGRVPLAVATSKVVTLAEPLLRHLGLYELFDVVAAPPPEAESESKADTVAKALMALGGPSQPVMIGDRLYDVLGAGEHGIPTIGVLWGVGGERELRAAGAAALASAPAEISRLLGL